MEISPDFFKKLSLLVKGYSGIILKKENNHLLKNRILQIMKKQNISSLGDFEGIIDGSIDGSIGEEFIIDLINSITNNESLFFRDIKVFNILENTIFPEIIQNKKRDVIRVWTTSCSIGQEPYSVSMMLDNNEEMKNTPYSILATDINTDVIERAKEGSYTQFEIQRGLPVSMLLKYFTQKENKWELSPSIKEKVIFRKFNLIDNPAILGKFDIIFCRNVFLYFDKATKLKILDSFYNCMYNHSILVLGASENLISLDTEVVAYKDFPGIFHFKDR